MQAYLQKKSNYKMVSQQDIQIIKQILESRGIEATPENVEQVMNYRLKMEAT